MSFSKNTIRDENPVNILARHVVDTDYEDLPQHVLAAAKTFILDSIGVGVAGSDGVWVEDLIRTVKRWGAGDQARVLVHGSHLPPTSAAIVNAYQIHCLEYDCVNEGAVLHPMATIMGAVLAEIDSGGVVSGRDLITAVATGVDSSCVLGLSSKSPMRFFRPSTAGAFGATAAVAKLRNFDTATLVNAYGATYGQISGTLQPHYEGSPVLGMQIGFCARGALSACDLAQAGLDGPKDIISGMYGYLVLYEGEFDHEGPFSRLGEDWQLSRVSHKPFPSGRLTHGMIDGVQRLQKKYGLKAADVLNVRCIVPPLAHRLTGRPDIDSPEPNYAKLCIPFVTATALIEGTVEVKHFRSAWLNKRSVHDLAARIKSIESNERDQNVMVPQRLEIDLRDGQRLAVDIPAILGHPDNPLSYDDNIEKFMKAWHSAAKPLSEKAAHRLVQVIDGLEEIADVRELLDLTMCT